jgi:hypothetical protein
MTDTPTPTTPTGADEPLSTERGLLAVDIFSGLLAELGRYQEEAAAWSARMGDLRALELTKAEADEHGVGAGHDWTTGPLRLPQPPSQQEVVAYIFPSLWAELRPQVARVAAIFLTTNAELEGAWDATGEAGYDAEVDRIISARVREVRFRMTPGDVARLVVGVIQRERGPLMQALGEGRALVAGENATSANGSSSPTGRATGRGSSTGSPRPTAGRRSKR